jgi:hypothetical protein
VLTFPQNFLIVYITPPAIRNIGYRTYIIFGVLNAAWIPIIYLFFPETKGLSLEEVDSLFAKNDETRRELDIVIHDEKIYDVERINDIGVSKT